MKKVSTRQKEEIEFLTEKYGYSEGLNRIYFKPTGQEVEEYLQHTVHGQQKNDNNRIFKCKKLLDILIKMWRTCLKPHRDLPMPITTKQEILEDWDNHPYVKKILNSIHL